MGRIKRYRTAISRYQHSKGFGLHSPFAFSFARSVLRERSPYYCYERLGQLRRMVIDRTRHHLRHPRVISLKSAKMVFRVTNHFNPGEILQIGTSYGVSSASMLMVSSRSHLTLFEPRLGEFPVTRDVLSEFGPRVTHCASLAEAAETYQRRLGPGQPFVLANSVADDHEYRDVMGYLKQALAGQCVVMVRNISRSSRMRALWSECKELTPHGMTFSNDKTAIIVANAKLPRQDFSMWF